MSNLRRKKSFFFRKQFDLHDIYWIICGLIQKNYNNFFNRKIVFQKLQGSFRNPPPSIEKSVTELITSKPQFFPHKHHKANFTQNTKPVQNTKARPTIESHEYQIKFTNSPKTPRHVARFETRITPILGNKLHCI